MTVYRFVDTLARVPTEVRVVPFILVIEGSKLFING